MISIVISSCKPEFLKQICLNIKNTIGVTHEIIVIKNYNEFSIARAYNIGGVKSKYPYVCFVHEDIIFKNKNWGITIINSFQENINLALIGVVGTKILSKFSIGWHNSILKSKFLVGRIMQGQNSWTEYIDTKFTKNNQIINDVV